MGHSATFQSKPLKVFSSDALVTEILKIAIRLNECRKPFVGLSCRHTAWI